MLNHVSHNPARLDAAGGELPAVHSSKGGLLHREVLFAGAFLVAFILLDGASTAAQTWEGAPACYLPVALSLALVLWSGTRYIPLILFSSILASLLNYHRPLFSWCGIPGACAIYAGYIIGALIVRRKWPIDLRLNTLRDIGRFVCVSLCGAIVSTVFGAVTLLLDGLIHGSDLLRTAVDWYASDILGIVTVSPFLLIFIAPRVSSYLCGARPQRSEEYEDQDWGQQAREWMGQAGIVVGATWLIFCAPTATPYQPLYLLFVPLVWAGLRRGMPGVAFITFLISISMSTGAGLTHATRGSLPRLQLASLVVGLTGLCIGAVVSERKRAERDLRRSESGLKESQRVARLGSWTLDPATGQVTWTEELYRMFGFDASSEPPTFTEHGRLFLDESWARLRRSMEGLVHTGQPYDLELQTVRADGGRGWIRARGEAQHDVDGTVTAVCGIAQDITERKRAEEALSFKTTLLEAQAETSIDGILVVDESERIILANKRFGLHFDIPNDLLATGDDSRVLKYVLSKVECPDGFVEKVNYLYRQREEKSRDEIKLINGKVFERYSAPLLDSKSVYRGRIWYFRDISDRKLSEQRVQFLAYYDALTGLPNRSLLQDRVTKAVARATRHKNKLALFFLDLDRFKAINDCLGHSVGDLLLQEVAKRLKKWGREQDTIARLGGDEFVLMLSDIARVEDAAVSAERVMDVMTGEFVVQGHSLSVGCSMGISIFPEHGSDAETLIKNADAAMYSAKDAGRNNFRFFSANMNAQTAERLLLENSLRSALDNHELFLAYQPQMEIASGAITGFEALLRWRHPELGLIPPDRFIKIAENSGLIVRIGEWVLRNACREARKWMDDKLCPVSVAVNVSVVQFRQEGFCKLVRQVLQETGLPAQHLELEITESMLVSDEDLMLSVLKELKLMGVRLSIDDFGTGYSSFSYLRKFLADKFKIDRSFVRDVATNPDDAAITAAIISMAKTLRLTVVAEGVENEAQMAFLRRERCDEIQGYYLSKPLLAEQVAEMLRATRVSARYIATNDEWQSSMHVLGGS